MKAIISLPIIRAIWLLVALLILSGSIVLFIDESFVQGIQFLGAFLMILGSALNTDTLLKSYPIKEGKPEKMVTGWRFARTLSSIGTWIFAIFTAIWLFLRFQGAL